MCLALPAVFAFYIGLSGPLTALILMPDDWGMAEAKSACVVIATHTYPDAMYNAIGRNATVAIGEYQIGWASLVLPEDETEDMFVAVD